MSDVSSMPFGGSWSGQKLIVLGDYLKAYTTALKNTPFRLEYIDGFAGSGTREVIPPTPGELFDDVLAADEANYRHGSPLIALGNDPPFDRFIFIERDSASIEKLKKQVAADYPARSSQVTYKKGGANAVLKEHIASTDWRYRRAVAFLDPFALHVSWATIELIAKTKSIDMWLLFPAMAVNRMLARDGDISEAWSNKLNDTFGSGDWKEVFYVKQQTDLFGNVGTSKVTQVFKALSEYVTRRLDLVFEAVVDSPLLLCNSTGSPLFLLCFGSGSPRGAEIAKRIASHIITKKSHGH